MVQSVRRNLYVVISLETKEPVATPFEIASHIMDCSYISHHSAFEFYGMANQVFSDVYVSAANTFRTFEFDDRNYHCLLTRNEFGISKQKLVLVTDIQRTILGSIKDFDFCADSKGNSSRYLYNDLKQEHSIFSKEWNLYVPEDLMGLINEGGDADV